MYKFRSICIIIIKTSVKRSEKMFILEELRKESGLKRSELARQLDINQNTLANYEKGLRQAPYETLIQIADYFSVSVDELLGRTSEKTVESSDFKPLSVKEIRLMKKIRNLNFSNVEKLSDYVDLLLISQNQSV